MIVQLKDTDGNIVNEKNIVLKEGDTLIVKYDQNIPTSTAVRIYDNITKSLEDNKKVIAIPDMIFIANVCSTSCINY